MGGTAETPALIIRLETANGYDYSVAPGQEEGPIKYVSYEKAQYFFKWWYQNKSSNEQGEGTIDAEVRGINCACPYIFLCDCNWCECRRLE